MSGQFFRSIRCMLASGEYADVRVNVGPQGQDVFYLHKILLVAHSEFFKAALENENFEEAKTGIVSLPEDEMETFRRFVAFIYTNDYNDGLFYSKDSDLEIIMQQIPKTGKSTSQDGRLELDLGLYQDPDLFSVILESAKLYCLAQKLLAKDVKQAAVDRMERIIDLCGCSLVLGGIRPETLETLQDVVELIYGQTARTDVEFKERLCWLVSRQWNNHQIWSSLLPIFQQHWDFHMGVMTYIRKPMVGCPQCKSSSTTDVVTKTSKYTQFSCRRCGNARRILKKFIRWGSDKFGRDEWMAQERERIQKEEKLDG